MNEFDCIYELYIYLYLEIASDLLLLFVTCLPFYNFLHQALFLLATLPFASTHAFFGGCRRSSGPTNLFSAQDLGLVTCRGEHFLLITRMLGQYMTNHRAKTGDEGDDEMENPVVYSDAPGKKNAKAWIWMPQI